MNEANQEENQQQEDGQDLDFNFEFDDGTEAPDEGEDGLETEEGEDQDGEPEEEQEGEEGDAAQRKPKVQFSEEQQEVFNTEIGKKVAKLRQTEQELEQAREKLQQFESQQQKTERPEVPPPPNIYAPDYEQQIQARDEAIRKQIEWDAAERNRTDRMVEQQREVEMQQQRVLNEKINTYTERAVNAGIPQEILAQAGAVVGNFVQDQTVIDHMLDDEFGARMTVYLAKNPLEAQKIAQMPAGKAIVYLETNIKPKASGAKKRPAPPPNNLRGGGTPPVRRGPKGATFE